MSDTQIYSSPYITVNYRPDKKIIHHTIHEPLGTTHWDEHKEALTAGVEALKKYGLCKWLSDDRKNGPLAQEILDWSEGWYPGAIEAGWKYWANVVPAEIIAASTLTPVINRLHDFGLRMAVFTSVESALEWLDPL